MMNRKGELTGQFATANFNSHHVNYRLYCSEAIPMPLKKNFNPYPSFLSRYLIFFIFFLFKAACFLSEMYHMLNSAAVYIYNIILLLLELDSTIFIFILLSRVVIWCHIKSVI
jgi:hypothetical protein